MPASLLCLAVLFILPHVDAAPAPDSAKQKLETLKKLLPGVLAGWVKEKNNITWLNNINRLTCKPELRVIRRVGPERAKAVILFVAYTENGENRYPPRDVVVTVHLSYHDGCWTAETFEASCKNEDSNELRRTFAFLMLAIDEAAEKP